MVQTYRKPSNLEWNGIIDVPDFFFRPPRISRFFFQGVGAGGPGGKQGVNWILGGGGPLGGRFRGSRGSVHGILRVTLL